MVGWSNLILDPTLALIRAQLGFRIQVGAECGKNWFLKIYRIQKNIIWTNVKRTIADQFLQDKYCLDECSEYLNIIFYENSGCTQNFSFIGCVEAH